MSQKNTIGLSFDTDLTEIVDVSNDTNLDKPAEASHRDTTDYPAFSTLSGSTILVVEDELILRELLAKSLTSSGYKVLTAENGVVALEQLAKHQVDLVLLDIMMPIMDGFGACEQIRTVSDVPIVMLTALNRPEDVARDLKLGADEYITKPFAFSEMKVRIEALLRRVSWSTGMCAVSTISGEGLVLDDETESVEINNEMIPLTPIEYRFLRYLMIRANQPISKETLLREVWEYDSEGNGAIIQSVVRRLRLKIEEDPSSPRFVVSVWGVGYKFQAPGSTEQMVAV
ncbi:response regulator transcription factor [Chloroflexi bacterium TSY]|nr:response regulator transcription factor [Chloroflexi bacterium TSY]